MKRIAFLTTTILFFFGALAQSDRRGSPHTHSFICSYYGEPVGTTPVMGFRSSAEAKEVINNIISVIGLKSNFEIRSATIPNAAAVVSYGKRYILYNPKFVEAIDRAAGDKWASIAILAHEIGHHLNGHTLMGTGSHPSLELEADEFSGFILSKMGASLNQAQSAMKIAADVRASRTHPAKDDRLTAIAEGWYKASGKAMSNVAKAPAQQPAETGSGNNTTEPIGRSASTTSSTHIAYDVRFTADQSTPYYVTTRGNLVTVKNSQLVVIGRAEKTGNGSYPFKITDDKTALFVARNGYIVTASGKQVGYMKNRA